MQKANANNLTDKQLEIGMSRFLNVDASELEMTVIESQLTDGRFQCRAQMWKNGKHKLIARIGSTLAEAQAKLGLALPVKAWGLL